MEKIVYMKGVVKKYKVGKVDFLALNDFDLTVDKGDFVTLTGPSGCGKTTVLNLIGCIDSLTEGNLLEFGQDITTASESTLARIRREKIGYIFQNFNLISVLTCLENVMYPLVLRNEANAKQKAIESLEKIGLGSFLKSRPGELSGGQRQRCAIARAFACNPEIILADEPTANLDSKNSAQVLELILKFIQEKQTTFIAVSHHDFFVQQSSRIIKMVDGKVVDEERSKHFNTKQI